MHHFPTVALVSENEKVASEIAENEVAVLILSIVLGEMFHLRRSCGYVF